MPSKFDNKNEFLAYFKYSALSINFVLSKPFIHYWKAIYIQKSNLQIIFAILKMEKPIKNIGKNFQKKLLKLKVSKTYQGIFDI